MKYIPFFFENFCSFSTWAASADSEAAGVGLDSETENEEEVERAFTAEGSCVKCQI
jgi:hypothetical protein